MPTFTVSFDCDNDAFVPNPRPEIDRILREIARRVERGDELHWFSTIYDANGNDIGRFALKPAGGAAMD